MRGFVAGSFLPVHYRAVFGVVAFLISPVVVDLVGHPVLVQLDTQAWACGQVQIAVAHGEGLLQVSLAERDLLLAEEVRNGCGELDSGGERDRTERIMWRDGGVVS